MMEQVKVISKSENEIIFASVGDLIKFWDELSNGKNILLIFEGENEIHSELLNPNNSPQINDGKVTLKSKEKKR